MIILRNLKTYFRCLFAFLVTLSATQGPCCEIIQEANSCCYSQPLVQFKMGYFVFSDDTMRKIYDKGGLDVQLCASYPLCELNKWSLNAYGAVEYFFKAGTSINEHQKTCLWSLPVNLGLKPVYAIDTNLLFYCSIGPRYFYIHQHNRSPYVSKNRSRNGVGFFVNTGLNYILCGPWMVDVFGEYSYAKVRMHSGSTNVYAKSVQVGGFTFGGALGCSF